MFGRPALFAAGFSGRGFQFNQALTLSGFSLTQRAAVSAGLDPFSSFQTITFCSSSRESLNFDRMA